PFRQEMVDIIGGPSRVEQLETPVVTRGTVEIGGEAFATLNLGFGSSVTASFVFAGERAGSAGNPGPAPYARPFLLGGLLEQIAGGLSTPSADDAGGKALAEVAVHAPGNPADVLLTVDTVLPDAKADLVRLQNADLAIVPTYVVGAAPATPLAPPRVDDRPDL